MTCNDRPLSSLNRSLSGKEDGSVITGVENLGTIFAVLKIDTPLNSGSLYPPTKLMTQKT
jgi:hypothetical protein